MSFWQIALAVACCLVPLACASVAVGNADERARRFIAEHEATIRPLEIDAARQWWAANLSGKDDDYAKKERIETELDLHLADAGKFAELKAIRDAKPADPLLARQIDLLFLQYQPKQLPADLLKAMLAKANAVEKTFNNYRPRVNGKELTTNDIRNTLRHSTDSAERQAVWEGQKSVGPKVEPMLRELVGLRNEAARKLGYRDYHVMQLALAEQDQADVLRLFDDLDRLTREPFQKAKAELDTILAANCHIAPEQLAPWHYHDPFFQESPNVFGSRFDDIYRPLDIVDLCRRFYAGIGLPVDDVLARSDLKERPGKNPHAFCTDIDRAGDVRVLANIVTDKYWLATMLHELGHAVYSSKNIPASVPYVLRSEAHTLTTEGIAMMYERFADNAGWLQGMGVHVPDPVAFNQAMAKARRNGRLIFSRWCQVMFRFEKELYGNPDQDLNRLWWDLVERYQEVRRPANRNAPDYASKIHIVSAPAYYHNYQMGQLFAAQLHAAIVRDVLGGGDPRAASYVGNRAAGEYVKQRVFVPGKTLPWNELTRRATGAALGPEALAVELTP